jgi:hypothetical protein
MPIALLLAMQASGMIVDWIGTRNQQKFADMGAKLQDASIESNIEQNRLQAEDDSLQALRKLRQTLGSQAAIFAARGTRGGAGSALSVTTESMGNFNSDERMRRMNLMGRETALKGGRLINRLNQQGENTKLWSGFAQRTFNSFPTSPAAWGQAGKSFGLTQEK